VSISEQQCLRAEIRARFPKLRWLDIVSKCDLPYQPLLKSKQSSSSSLSSSPSSPPQYAEYIGAIDDGGGEILADIPPVRPVSDDRPSSSTASSSKGKQQKRHGDIDDDEKNEQSASVAADRNEMERARGGTLSLHTAPSSNAVKAELESDEYRWRRQRAINEVTSTNHEARILHVITHVDIQPTHSLHVSTEVGTGITDLKLELFHHFKDQFPPGFQA
jgi:hypothetical protein